MVLLVIMMMWYCECVGCTIASFMATVLPAAASSTDANAGSVAARYFDAAEELHKGKGAILAEANAARVLQLYQQASAANNRTAQLRVAQLLLMGPADVRDREQALAELRTLVATGRSGCTREAAEAAMLLGAAGGAEHETELHQLLLLAAVCSDNSARLILENKPGQQQQCTTVGYYLNAVAHQAQVRTPLARLWCGGCGVNVAVSGGSAQEWRDAVCGPDCFVRQSVSCKGSECGAE